MKKLTYLFVIALLSVTACKNSTSEENSTDRETLEIDDTEEVIKVFPDQLNDVFDAHGGYAKWNEMNAMTYEITKGEAVEEHVISLKDRRVRLDHPDWSIGYDGKDVWLQENKEEAYKGNARFYHNLYFYFYAMPFVLSDDGISYELMPATQLLDREYEGIKVSYADGVGDSPKDEYILYYDPETKLMEWLGYTVTYKSNEKSESWSFIHYSDWISVNELLLPKTLTWYTSENNSPKEVRSSREFQNIAVSEDVLQGDLFKMPEGAEVVDR